MTCMHVYIVFDMTGKEVLHYLVIFQGGEAHGQYYDQYSCHGNKYSHPYRHNTAAVIKVWHPDLYLKQYTNTVYVYIKNKMYIVYCWRRGFTISAFNGKNGVLCCCRFLFKLLLVIMMMLMTAGL